jgi:hypothetical protein
MTNNSWIKTLNRDEARSRKKETLINVAIFIGIVAVIVTAWIISGW